MIVRRQRITIIRTSLPRNRSINEEIMWLGKSLGLFSERDSESSLYRVFVELIKSSKIGPISSDELAYRLGLSRGTVVHHLNKLLESGMIVRERHGYVLRDANLEVLVDELRKDLRRAMDTLKEMAKRIDEGLGV